MTDRDPGAPGAAHPDLRPLLDGRLDVAARAHVLAHVARCSRCRLWYADAAPERLFALLATRAVPQEKLDRLSATVAAAIDARRPQRLPSAATTKRRGWASLAASVLLAGLLGTYLWTREEVARVSRAPAPTVSMAASADEPRPEFELISSPGTAQVLDLTVGETQVVMIFDEAMDL